MRDLAADAKKLSETMRVDSSTMKSISIVTMIFLPGTAIAVRQPTTLTLLECQDINGIQSIFSMGSFFSTSPNGDLIISKQFWVYWLLTIPITISVFGFWWFWTGTETKRILWKKLEADFEAIQHSMDQASNRVEHNPRSGNQTGTEFSATVATAVNISDTTSASVLLTERRIHVE